VTQSVQVRIEGEERMFEHDEPLGEDTLSAYQEQEIEQEAAEYGLTPTEVIELEEQETTMDSLPPAEAEEYEQEVVSAENEASENSFENTMEQAQEFDQNILDG
jgi:hypothetical protein